MAIPKLLCPHCEEQNTILPGGKTPATIECVDCEEMIVLIPQEHIDSLETEE